VQRAARRVLASRRLSVRVTTHDQVLRRCPRAPRFIGRAHPDRAIADHDTPAIAAHEYLQRATNGRRHRDRELADTAAVEHHPFLQLLHPHDAHVLHDVVDFQRLDTRLRGIEIDGCRVPFIAAEAGNAIGAGAGVEVEVPGKSRINGHVDVSKVQRKGRALRIDADKAGATPQEHAPVVPRRACAPIILLFTAWPSPRHEIRDCPYRDVREFVGHPLPRVGIHRRVRRAPKADEMANAVGAGTAEIRVRPDRAATVAA